MTKRSFDKRDVRERVEKTENYERIFGEREGDRKIVEAGSIII